MRFSLTSLIRLFVISSLGLSAIAIGAAQMAPSPRNWRSASVVRHVSLNSFLFVGERTQSRWLDPSTGQVIQLKLPKNDVLEYASCSPWHDETGQAQVVGRWSRRQGQKLDATSTAFGLARLRFPSGEVLDQFETDLVPIGVPCWSEGQKAQVTFAAGDGALYQVSFDGSEAERQPREIPWAAPMPGSGKVWISDPTWIENRPDRKLLVVSMRVVENIDDRHRYSPLRLYWLRISNDGGSILDSGPLTPPQTKGSGEIEDRCPTIYVSNDGQRSLAYLRRTSGDKKWELRITALDLLENETIPVVRREGRMIASPCQAMAPAFSIDGRWISTLRGDSNTNRELVRLSVEPEREGIASVDRISTEL